MVPDFDESIAVTAAVAVVIMLLFVVLILSATTVKNLIRRILYIVLHSLNNEYVSK